MQASLSSSLLQKYDGGNAPLDAVEQNDTAMFRYRKCEWLLHSLPAAEVKKLKVLTNFRGTIYEFHLALIHYIFLPPPLAVGERLKNLKLNLLRLTRIS
jgi:hypothetical protein